MFNTVSEDEAEAGLSSPPPVCWEQRVALLLPAMPCSTPFSGPRSVVGGWCGLPGPHCSCPFTRPRFNLSARSGNWDSVAWAHPAPASLLRSGPAPAGATGDFTLAGLHGDPAVLSAGSARASR